MRVFYFVVFLVLLVGCTPHGQVDEALNTDEVSFNAYTVDLLDDLFVTGDIDGKILIIKDLEYIGPPLTLGNMRKELDTFLWEVKTEDCVNAMIKAKRGYCSDVCGSDSVGCRECILDIGTATNPGCLFVKSWSGDERKVIG